MILPINFIFGELIIISVSSLFEIGKSPLMQDKLLQASKNYTQDSINLKSSNLKSDKQMGQKAYLKSQRAGFLADSIKNRNLDQTNQNEPNIKHPIINKIKQFWNRDIGWKSDMNNVKKIREREYPERKDA